ncbi:hypothetical protein HBI81_032230 [Parastagonospora nodorum]|nr:hypothetical protein HBH75_027630 [Parastagonospora nodorum]KAH4934498.1 hypothetical protein HBI79_086520 [Parastagonospora nodorum]KAH5525683.1 hypothetical protein HBI29_025420 [Parastagonospora nodorum]KAH6014604.1 hypothetical protein HBI83_142900 [Parastagonospora nodorum]KAH6473307.1 hypothetical protein HBI59_023970 [Parastagonospora nodorum]
MGVLQGRPAAFNFPAVSPIFLLFQRRSTRDEAPREELAGRARRARHASGCEMRFCNRSRLESVWSLVWTRWVFRHLELGTKKDCASIRPHAAMTSGPYYCSRTHLGCEFLSHPITSLSLADALLFLRPSAAVPGCRCWHAELPRSLFVRRAEGRPPGHLSRVACLKSMFPRCHVEKSGPSIPLVPGAPSLGSAMCLPALTRSAAENVVEMAPIDNIDRLQ